MLNATAISVIFALKSERFFLPENEIKQAGMHYLTCGNCGFENEVTSEYLVFCGNCNKKMAGNFPSWRSENPGKNLEDYKNEVCHTKPVSVTNQQDKTQQLASPKRFFRNLILGVIVIAVVSLAGFFLINHLFFQTLEKYTKSEWSVQTCGDLGLRLNSPVGLKQDELVENNLPRELKNILVSIESYVYEERNKKLYIMANSFQYRPDVTASLNGAVEGSIRETRGRAGVSGFTYEITNISYYDLPGRLITGRWKEGKIVVGFQQAIYTQGSFMWQIMVGFDYQDPFGQEIATRIISSIMINKDFAAVEVKNLITSLPEADQQGGAHQYLLVH
jgi:hypothetical protein